MIKSLEKNILIVFVLGFFFILLGVCCIWLMVKVYWENSFFIRNIDDDGGMLGRCCR